MKRSYRTILSAAVFLSASSLASPGYAMSPREKAHAIVGTLQKVEGRSITVQTSKGTEAVLLVSGSRIQRGAKTLQVGELSSFAGQKVKVRYVEHNGEKEAETVTLASAAK